MAGENIRINDLPSEASPSANDVVPIDGLTTRKTTLDKLVAAGRPLASQEEAEAGTQPTKAMTPLTVAQAIAAQGGTAFATASQGALADTALQPGEAATLEQGALADSAVQPDDLGDLATKNKAAVSDIDATGTASATTFLRGDGSWTTPAGGGDVVGPSISIDGNVALMDGLTGKLIKDSGVTVDQLLALPPGHLYNLTLSNNVTDATNDIDIAPGACRSIADDANIKLASAITKRLDAAWAVGSGNGGLDTGSKANSTWYHVFAIRRPDTGVCDVLFSTSPNSPTMPANYTQKRRIGSIFVDGSGVIQPFLQKGGWFHWLTPVTDANALAIGASASLSLTVPLGIKVIHDGAWFPRLAGNYFAVRDPDLGNAATLNDSVVYSPNPASGVATGGAQIQCWTNTTRQVLIFGNASGTLLVFTRGWYDPRDTYV